MNTYEQQNITLDEPVPVAMISAEKRATFLKRIYGHVALAFLGFILIEAFLFVSGIADYLFSLMTSSQFVMLGIVFGFMFAAGAVEKWAHKATNKSTQYFALGLYALMEAIFFIPIISIAFLNLGSNAIMDLLVPAGMFSVGLFAGLVATAFLTGKDFSFLKTGLVIGFGVAIALIIFSTLFGMDLGAWFSVAMILLMAGAILFQTSKILKTYHEEQYVMAAVSVFASFMTLLFYVLRLFMSRD